MTTDNILSDDGAVRASPADPAQTAGTPPDSEEETA